MKGKPPGKMPGNQENDAQIHVVREMEIKTLMSLFTYPIEKKFANLLQNYPCLLLELIFYFRLFFCEFCEVAFSFC